ncbi:D-2-hydroxyacid dehydrogenase [Sandaracinobacteroides hominis]|uniref:D-2-hydroxyacid dehydrogenase n=1 Tax=Sandaracinobacteroides hominis TaxID=2780086 RepID=UPI0018F5C3CD|nr:D-2-hydroxyacid dehydrogenase [Sandaracinobacteroides hominis]
MMDSILLIPSPGGLAAGLEPLKARMRVAGSVEDALPHAAEVRALIALPHSMTRELVQVMPKLEWIQTLSAGVDPLLPLGIPERVRISNAAGLHAPQMSELVFFQLLTMLRDTRAIFARQAAHQWKVEPQRLLWGKKLLITGVGQIAVALAKRAQAFDMEVTGVSGGRTKAEGFDRIRPTSELHAALAEADFVVVLTPYTPATHEMFDEAAFAAMRPHVLFINVGRGKVVKQADLLAALVEGRIAGAALDVFETEPLPADSPVWDAPNMLVTPHIGGFSDSFVRQVTPFLLQNFANWDAGRPLLNEVRLS